MLPRQRGARQGRSADGRYKWIALLFAALLGVNLVGHLLASKGVLSTVPAAARQVLTGRDFFPELISAPFHHGLSVVFAVAAGLALAAGLASSLRGGWYIHPETVARGTPNAAGQAPASAVHTRAGPADRLAQEETTAHAEDL